MDEITLNRTNGGPVSADSSELQEKLSDPEVNKALVRLLERADTLELMLSATEEMVNKSAEIMDSMKAQQLASKRLSGSLALLEKLSDPDVTSNLSRVLDKLESVDILLSAVDDGLNKLPELSESLNESNVRRQQLDYSLEILDKISQPEVLKTFSRMVDKMETIELMVNLADEAVNKLPALTKSFEEEGNTRETTESYVQIFQKLGQPAVVQNLNNLLDKIGNLDAVINILDVVVANNPALKEPNSQAAENISELVAALTESMADEEKTLINTVKGGTQVLNEINHLLLSRKMQVIFHGMALSMQQKKDEVPKVGAFGLIKMLNDPDVKKSLGLLSVLLKSIGQELDMLDCASIPENDPGKVSA